MQRHNVSHVISAGTMGTVEQLEGIQASLKGKHEREKNKILPYMYVHIMCVRKRDTNCDFMRTVHGLGGNGAQMLFASREM